MLEEILSLLLVDVLTRASTYILFEFQQLGLAVHGLQSQHHSLVQRSFLQHVYLLFGTEEETRTNIVQQYHIVVDILYRKLCLVGYLLILFNVVQRQRTQVVNGCLEDGIVFLWNLVGRGMHHSHQERPYCRQSLQLTPA